jgi:hypothetical protein
VDEEGFFILVGLLHKMGVKHCAEEGRFPEERLEEAGKLLRPNHVTTLYPKEHSKVI